MKPREMESVKLRKQVEYRTADRMEFELIGAPITDIETIAVGRRIRDLAELQEQYGGRRWRKLKGRTLIRRPNGFVYLAEVHWYEAHGIGRRRMKVKRLLERQE